MFKKISILAMALVILTGITGSTSAETIAAVPEKSISIANDGHVIIKGAQVQQLAGKSFFMRVYWGEIFLRVLVRTDGNTKFTRYSGGVANLSEVEVGDYLNIEGSLTTSASALDVTATSVQNWSLKTDQSRFSGKVTKLSTDVPGFILLQKNGGSIKVSYAPDVVITRGKLSWPAERIKVGDSVTMASGTFDLTSSSLIAKNITVYQDRARFWPQNFSGVYKGSDSVNLPAVLTITISGVDYKVYLRSGSQVWNNLKQPSSISRYLVGDSIRIYGAIRESLDPIIDAEIVRNTNL